MYLLEIPSEKQEGLPKYYVGETDSFSRRIKKHRSKKADGMRWKEISAAVAPLPSGGKSHARMIETSLIKQLTKGGFDLVSKDDGKHTRFSIANS